MAELPNPVAQTPVAVGPRTRDEWIATHAISWSINWANGVDTGFGNSFFSNDAFAARGLTAFGASDYNVGQGGDATFTYGAAAQAAAYAFDNWASLTPAERSAFLNPIGADGKPLPNIPYVDPNVAIDSYNAETDRIRGLAAANLDNARAQAALQGAANEAQDIGNRFTLGMAQVAADRERTAAQVGIANADRAENARQFNARLKEDQRQFDLNFGENRRQFNATMVANLLQTGAQLAAKPVDWVAHQFYMANLGVPLSFLNFTTIAGMLGAIPPTGPSAAGPVTGGPAVMDGDLELAQEAGVQNAGFASLSEAVTANPGWGGNAPQLNLKGYVTPVTASNIVAQQGSLEIVDQQITQARTTEVVPAVGDNAVTQGFVATVQAQQMPEGEGPGGPILSEEPLPQPTGAYGKQLTQLGNTWYDANAQPGMETNGQVAPVSSLQFPQQREIAPPPVPSQTGITSPAATENRGPATGAPTEAPANNPVSVFTGATSLASATNPSGELLVQTLAAQLGIDPATLRNVIPPSMMAGGYSVDTIRNSPVVQALVNGADRMSLNRTAPADELGGERFSQIQAFGIPLGIRSGQDINAGLLLKSNPDQQQMIQGAVEATGQYYPTAVAQSLRASPQGQYAVGAFGRRRFG